VGDVGCGLSSLRFAARDRGSDWQCWLCLSRHEGGYGWCGDVGRLNDKVAEGGTEVERLEYRVGVTVWHKMRVRNIDMRWSARATTNNAPSISKLYGIKKKSEREREFRWNTQITITYIL
jgi:hypothetical protein